MEMIAIRHELSYANDAESEAFGQSDARLMPLGIERCKDIRRNLIDIHGIDIENTEVAASELFRSQHTASTVGFTAIKTYKILNEVDVSKTPELRAKLDKKIIIPEAYQAAELVRANPPSQEICFMHGYLIAALTELTGFDSTGLRFIPHFGEIRKLTL